METALVDRALAKECLRAIKHPNRDTIVCQWVNRIDKKKKEKIAFLVSVTVTVFLDKKFSLIEKVPNNSFTQISLQNMSTILISAGKFQIAIEHPSAHMLFKFFASHLYSILTENEMPKLHFDPQLLEKVNPTKSFIKRFAYLCEVNRLKVPDDFLNDLADLFSRKKMKMLNFVQNEWLLPYLDIILNCLDFQPSITSVKIPNAGKITWQALAECLKTNRSLKSIIIFQPYDPSFTMIIDALAQNKGTRLRKMTFGETSFQESEGPLLKALLSLNILDTLEFDKCFTASCFSAILPMLSESSGFKRLKSIGFNGINGLMADNIFAKMPWLTSISLLNSNINVSAALKILPPTIEKFKITGGNATDPIPEFVVPKKLVDIQLSKINWTPQSLAQVITMFFNHNPEFPPQSPAPSPRGKQQQQQEVEEKTYFVDLSDSQMTEDQWNEFSSMSIGVTNPNPQMNHFVWDNNPISPSIINVLSSMNEMKSISVSGSLNANTILTFCEFVTQSKFIKTVTINGGLHKLKPDECVTLMRGLINCTNIEELCINDHGFGQKGAVALAELLHANKTIRYAEFMNNNMLTRESWFTFFEKIMDRGPPLEIPWPEEIMNLYKKKIIKQNDLDHLHDCWKNVENGCEDAQGEDVGEAMDFGVLEDAEQEEDNEQPVDVNWDLQTEHVPLVSTEKVCEQTLKRLSYKNVINIMQRV